MNVFLNFLNVKCHLRMRRLHLLRLYSAVNFGDLKTPVIAIRRETVNVWERRAPLGPSHVRHLVRDGFRVLVQPSNRRAFTSIEYINSGAIIQEDISEAQLILGVKQVPLDHASLMPNKTYAFFSHTIKAQEANMSLLDTILERNIRLIDYERILDNRGQRLVAFGKFAGVAGMINILHGIGLRFLALGCHTPFMYIGLAHNYPSVGVACAAIRECGYEIALGNMPKSIGPLIFLFTGTGNVSTGAQEIFQQLPYEMIEAKQLEKVASKGNTNKIYGCVVSRSDHYRRRSDGGFDSDEFQSNPELYSSTFAHEIAPYVSVIVNGIYYAPNSPRLVSIPNAKQLLRIRENNDWMIHSPGCPPLPNRLVGICDISADPGGSIEFMKECTTIDKPFCIYDAEENMSYEKFDGPGVLICSIDNMPAQLPREATNYFGDSLLPHIYEMATSDANSKFEDWKVSDAVKNACITSNMSLTNNYKYIADLREFKRLTNRISRPGKKSILVLGSGHIVPPFLKYFENCGDVSMTMCSSDKDEVLRIADKFSFITPEIIDVISEDERTRKLIKSHDLVVSMLPNSMHDKALNYCLKEKKNLITASYLTPALNNRSKEIIDKGITVVMEMGLDPGLDHMLTMEIVDQVKEGGGKIRSYRSYTGGLPAPEHSENPLRYKFSWSPESALLTAINGAKYIKNGRIKEISPGGDLMQNCKKFSGIPGFNLEYYPNRDSTTYAQLYGLEDSKVVIRGTLRYRGFCEIMSGIIKLGLMNFESDPYLHPKGPEITWKKYLAKSFGLREDVFIGTLKDVVFEKLLSDRLTFNSIEELGFFDDTTPMPSGNTPIRSLAMHLSNKLSYGPSERDIVIMTHETIIEWPDQKIEKRDTRLVVYGDPEESGGFRAMARTVSLPCAIAAKMMLESEIQTKGFVLPLKMDIYRPILKRLKQEGIVAQEKITVIDSLDNLKMESL